MFISPTGWKNSEIGDRVTIMRDGAKVGTTYRQDEIRMNEMIERSRDERSRISIRATAFRMGSACWR